MRRPKVVHVVRQCWPLMGGLEESVRQIACTMRARFDADVEIVTLSRTFADGHRLPKADMVEGVPIRRIEHFGSRRYPIAPAFLAATRGADIIHVHGIDFFFDAFAASRLMHRKPLVASTHGGFFHTDFAQGLKQVYFRTVTRVSAAAYSVIGASSEQDAVHFRRIAGGRVRVIENGVDAGKWADAACRTPQPAMIAIGRWSSNKGLSGLFPLLHELRTREPAWRLIIAGRPYDLGVTDLRAAAKAAGVEEAVEISESPDIETIREMIGRASYFVSLSAYEGFGIAAVEGLSAGLVPLLSDIPQYRVLIERAKIGRIFAGRSSAEDAATIVSLHESMRGDRGEARKQAIAAAAHYDWGAVAAEWLDIYAGLHRVAGHA
jgi:alpha-1,3-mannosyltransferase